MPPRIGRILLMGWIVLLANSAAAEVPAPAPTVQIPALAPMLERILPGVVAISANGGRLALRMRVSAFLSISQRR
jgi:hypothetical protein